MNILSKNSAKSLGKSTLAAAVLGGFLLFAGAPAAKANDGSEGDRRVDRAEWNLHEAIEHHGYYSRQAAYWRHELREEQERCRREHERREHRDYDRHRYDRDRD
jgi:hypothetical protein